MYVECIAKIKRNLHLSICKSNTVLCVDIVKCSEEVIGAERPICPVGQTYGHTLLHLADSPVSINLFRQEAEKPLEDKLII